MPLSSNKKSSRKAKILPQFSIYSGNKPLLDLLEIQRKSFFDLLERGIIDELSKTETFRETAKFSGFTQELELSFNPETYKLVSPNCTPKEAILKGKTYACKLYVQATLTIRSSPRGFTGETDTKKTLSRFLQPIQRVQQIQPTFENLVSSEKGFGVKKGSIDLVDTTGGCEQPNKSSFFLPLKFPEKSLRHATKSKINNDDFECLTKFKKQVENNLVECSPESLEISFDDLYHCNEMQRSKKGDQTENSKDVVKQKQNRLDFPLSQSYGSQENKIHTLEFNTNVDVTYLKTAIMRSISPRFFKSKISHNPLDFHRFSQPVHSQCTEGAKKVIPEGLNSLTLKVDEVDPKNSKKRDRIKNFNQKFWACYAVPQESVSSKEDASKIQRTRIYINTDKISALVKNIEEPVSFTPFLNYLPEKVAELFHFTYFNNFPAYLKNFSRYKKSPFEKILQISRCFKRQDKDYKNFLKLNLLTLKWQLIWKKIPRFFEIDDSTQLIFSVKKRIEKNNYVQHLGILQHIFKKPKNSTRNTVDDFLFFDKKNQSKTVSLPLRNFKPTVSKKLLFTPSIEDAKGLTQPFNYFINKKPLSLPFVIGFRPSVVQNTATISSHFPKTYKESPSVNRSCASTNFSDAKLSISHLSVESSLHYLKMAADFNFVNKTVSHESKTISQSNIKRFTTTFFGTPIKDKTQEQKKSWSSWLREPLCILDASPTESRGKSNVNKESGFVKEINISNQYNETVWDFKDFLLDNFIKYKIQTIGNLSYFNKVDRGNNEKDQLILSNKNKNLFKKKVTEGDSVDTSNYWQSSVLSSQVLLSHLNKNFRKNTLTWFGRSPLQCFALQSGLRYFQRVEPIEKAVSSKSKVLQTLYFSKIEQKRKITLFFLDNYASFAKPTFIETPVIWNDTLYQDELFNKVNTFTEGDSFTTKKTTFGECSGYISSKKRNGIIKYPVLTNPFRWPAFFTKGNQGQRDKQAPIFLKNQLRLSTLSKNSPFYFYGMLKKETLFMIDKIDQKKGVNASPTFFLRNSQRQLLSGQTKKITFGELKRGFIGDVDKMENYNQLNSHTEKFVNGFDVNESKYSKKSEILKEKVLKRDVDFFDSSFLTTLNSPKVMRKDKQDYNRNLQCTSPTFTEGDVKEGAKKVMPSKKNESVKVFHPWIFLGELPLMTKRGHFILNGSPRVIVNQIARCPGIYFQEKRRGVGFEQEVRVSADLIPQRGPWLRIQSDWEGRFWARLKREGRVKYATLYSAFQEFEKQYSAPLVNLLTNNSSPFPKSEIVAFHERKAKEDRQKKALVRLFKNSTRYSLGKQGRLRINQRVHFGRPCAARKVFQRLTTSGSFNLVNNSFILQKVGRSVIDKIDKESAVQFEMITASPTKLNIDGVNNQKVGDNSNSKAVALAKVSSLDNFASVNRVNNEVPFFSKVSSHEVGSPFQDSTNLLYIENVRQFLTTKTATFFSPIQISDFKRVKFTSLDTTFTNSTFDSNFQFEKFTEGDESYSHKISFQKGINQVDNQGDDDVKKENLLMAADVNAVHTCLEHLLEGQGFTDDIDHLKNRLVRTSGKLLQQQLELGLHRLNEVMTPLLGNLIQGQLLSSLSPSEDTKENITDEPLRGKQFTEGAKKGIQKKKSNKINEPLRGKQWVSSSLLENETPFRWLRTSKPVNNAFREFFGSNPLSQYMDQTNPLAEITHKRRLSSMGPGGIKRETAGMEVRGIHPTHYGRVCPIETPEGKNAGLVNSPTVYGRIGKNGFMETPLYQVLETQVQKERWTFFSAQQEEDQESSLATGDTGLTRFNLLLHGPIPVQTANNPLAHFQQVERNRVGYKALSPVQTISIATALIPFLEHDDANRALMGSNMQRQAIPLLLPERPIVGTGFESMVMVESGQAVQATKMGCVSHVSASKIILESIHSIWEAPSRVRPCEIGPFGYSRIQKGDSISNMYRKFFHTMEKYNNVWWNRNTLIRCLEPFSFLNSNDDQKLVSDCLLQMASAVHRLYSATESCNGSTGKMKQVDQYDVPAIKVNKVDPIQNRYAKYKLIEKRIAPFKKTPKIAFAQKKFKRSLRNFWNCWEIFCESQKSSRGFKIGNYLVSEPVPMELLWYVKKPSCNSFLNIHFVKNTLESNFLSQSILLGAILDPEKLSMISKKTVFSITSRDHASKMQRDLKSEILMIKEQNYQLRSTNVDKRKDYNQGFKIEDFKKKDQANGFDDQHKTFFCFPGFLFMSFTTSPTLWTCLTALNCNLSLDHVKNVADQQWKQNLQAESINQKKPTKKSKAFLNNFPPFFDQIKDLNSFADYEKRKANSFQCDLINVVDHHQSLQSSLVQESPSFTEGAMNGPVVSKEINEKTNFKDKIINQVYGMLHISNQISHQTATNVQLCSNYNALLLKKVEQPLQIYQRSNQETCLSQRPLVREGDWVNKGDFLADGSASKSGDLALGKNVTVAYMPWEGYNFEDAIVISDRLVANDVYTSIHIERYEIKVSKNSQGKERITNQIPSLPSQHLKHLDNSGIARVSSWVQPGDILVGKVVELKRPLSPYERLAWELASRLSPSSPEREKWLSKVWLEDISLRLPPGVCGRVINFQIISTEWSEKDQLAHPIEVHVYLAVKRKIQVGDKLAGRHGNKGIVSIVLPRQDMPYLGDGNSVDMVLNPLGVPSRMNLGQIFECLLGLAGSQLGCNFKVTPFDEIAGGEASRSLVFLKLYQCRLMYKQQWLFTPTFPGKNKLFDGRTGEPFENWVTVGQAYMLKLIHMVDHKIHARSTGPYSLFTRQPVRGRSRRGGQRLGEMEVWAVEGFGAAYTLQEFLTIKSDDLKARAALQRSFYKQNDVTLGKVHISPGNPEAFRVLVSELQALCLHIQM